MSKIAEYTDALRAISQGRCSMARWLREHGEVDVDFAGSTTDELRAMVARSVLGMPPLWLDRTDSCPNHAEYA